MNFTSKNRANRLAAHILIFVAATSLLLYLLPREERSKYVYEENRPWTYQLLTAPFDVPVFLDSVRSQAIKDSIDAHFEPVFKRDKKSEMQQLKLATEGMVTMAGRRLNASQRQLLINEIGAIYELGIVDTDTYLMLRRGTLPGLRILNGNVAQTAPASQFYSPRKAYERLDSVVRRRGMHDQFVTSQLVKLLSPNLSPDTSATTRFRNEAYQSALAPVGVIQQGERIIDRGDIVTPRLYTILTTYERMATARGEQINVDRYYTLSGQAMYIMLLLGALYIYLYFYRRDYWGDTRVCAFLILLVTAFAAFAMVMPQSWLSGIFVVPFTVVIVTTVVFLDSRTAFFTYMVTLLLSLTGARLPLEFIMVEFIAGLTALVSIKDLSRRSQLLRSALLVFATYCVSYVAVEMMQTGSMVRVSGAVLGGFAINAVMISFAYVLIFIFEKLFGFTSKVTLVELSDINNPLLRELSEECPGTFQHSMAVSNLATTAARRIGADVQLVRTGALYHDIGKLGNPAFFTENQHGVNPHDGLDPRQSAAIVIGHIAEGLRRAERAKLPKRLRDFISEHHGAGKARYFYTTYCNQHPGEEVDPAPFTYPGPNPRSRETSILMMADAVEAASRSLNDHNEDSIRALVNRIIDAQIDEGLHNDSPISFRDIREIKDSFVSRLRTIYHARISYPEARTNPADTSGVNK